VNRRLTGNHYHQYLQPDRDIDEGAIEVHGITPEFLSDKPRFPDIVDEFLGFVEGAELIIHNAPFDLGFIEHELTLSGNKRIPSGFRDRYVVIDTLVLARQLHPGQRNSLDALCKRYSIDNSERTLHGALLDAEILADVYLAMTGGQASLTLSRTSRPEKNTLRAAEAVPHAIPSKVIRAISAELDAHRQRLRAIDEASGGKCLWNNTTRE
jgi:DNA polymerase-3 subunit epsilon